MIIISQCIHISKYHLVYLRDKQCLFVNYIIKVKDVDDGVFMIKNRLRHKKILLVLDDVNELDQLYK